MVQQAMRNNPDLSIAALGGQHLAEVGADVVFDLIEHSVVGFVEVLKHYAFFKRLFEEVISWIKTHRPKAICFVDYPGFNLRLADALAKADLSKQAGGDIPLLYYISPQVWAWKTHRKYTMAKLLDSLAVIFPFEVETFADTGLETVFVGHPFMEPDYNDPISHAANGLILLLPGSRLQPVKRIFPAMLAGFAAFANSNAGATAAVISPSEAVRTELEAVLARHPAIANQIAIIDTETPVGARAVLTSSGTISLRVAIAGIPGAIAYRAHPLTFAMAKRFVKLSHIGIANLLLNRVMYPEYLQHAASPVALADALSQALITDRLEQTRVDSAALRSTLSTDHAFNAGEWLINRIA